MAQTVTQVLAISDAVTETLAFGSASSVTASATSSPSFTYTTGTTSTAIDLHWEHSYTLASSATVTLTLSALTDDLGRAVAFARVKRLSVYITAKTGQDYLTVGNAVSNPFVSILGGTTPTYLVGGYDLKVRNDTTGFTVTASSADQLKFVNSGSASITFLVSITGCSA